MNHREETIDLYNQGLAICPDDDVAHYELGRALADAGRSAQAEKEFETALERLIQTSPTLEGNWKTCAKTATPSPFIIEVQLSEKRSMSENVSGRACMRRRFYRPSLDKKINDDFAALGLTKETWRLGLPCY